ncbi:hypothetical protein PAXRUDRAFT_824580 [Paxillus rubicundulus Ve08.2h10]|uniref:Cytoplasmic tRNA 2-thiolation protein 2 n=1 Tax=Paxillus rubicundulus Ve08.2h10 TaxID=930991 RepID=A0A0D0DU70_9AGAM|nr:hypothetical protein PAXRUDRAFT_824580 [Paxillus rubicundulus Ve08.2h10]
MSSCGNPIAEDAALMPRRFKFDKVRDCIKCKLNPGNIVIRHAVYCKDCLTPLVTLKFRRALEPLVNASSGTSKRPKLKASGSLTLGFSGGLGSSVLLDIVYKTYFANQPSVDPSGEPRGGANHPRNTNVWSSCAVCYVEVCNAFTETRDRTEEIRTALAPYPKFDFIPLRLEDAFDASWWSKVATTPDQSQLGLELGKDGLCTEGFHLAACPTLPPAAALRSYLASLPTQTAVSSAIKVIVRLLLLYTARSRQSSHLLLGTSLTTLSISLVSSISQGGGHSILEELQEEWTCGGESTTSEKLNVIRVVRPLRDVTMKECAAFGWWNSIAVVGRDKQARASAGIPGLTQDFIVGLEKDYPSTVSTIARTCAKLEPKSASRGSCILCQRPLQEGLEDWKNRISIRSYSDAKLTSDLCHLPLLAPFGASELSTPPHQPPSILTHLCYSCQATFTSRSSRGPKPAPSSIDVSGALPLSTPLPVWVSANHTRPHVAHEELVMSANGEIWYQKKQGEAENQSVVAKFLLDT